MLLFRAQKGFSLMELSLVMVVIGLLAGAILVAQNLMRSSEVLSVMSEVEKIKLAVNHFQTKYTSLPGDLATAENYWGSDAGCPATATNTVAKRETCNGNGDGQIGDWNSGTNAYEWFRAWQHLSNAGLIEGTFSGVLGTAAQNAKALVRINVPASKMEGAGYLIVFFGSYNSADFFSADYRHAIFFGKGASGNSPPWGVALTPEEAWQIDQKFDDGRPAYGDVMAYKSTSTAVPNCTTTAVETTSAYNLTNAAKLCALLFLGEF